MIWFKWLLIAIGVLFVTLVGVSWLALEQSEVIDIQTVRHDGTGNRSTRAWFVIDGNRVLLEAGNPNNPWVLDIAVNKRVGLSGGGLNGNYCTSRDDSAEAHNEIRARMRNKYGWRDQWVDQLFDVSRSARVVAEPCV